MGRRDVPPEEVLVPLHEHGRGAGEVQAVPVEVVLHVVCAQQLLIVAHSKREKIYRVTSQFIPREKSYRLTQLSLRIVSQYFESFSTGSEP